MAETRGFTLSVAVDPKNDHVRGDPSAPVTLVEYGDFECPSCKQAAPALKLMFDHFSPHVCLVYRHFPLVEVHPHALAAAEAAEAAGAQGEFWRMHDRLFAGTLEPTFDTVRHYAVELGLDIDRFDREARNDVYRKHVEAQMKSGRDSGVRSTPGIFLNGRIADVSFGIDALFRSVEAQLKQA
jgi:protein-disulfide isomerase